MRIATWNLAGRWDGRHLELLQSLDCDLLLLTEVSDRAGLPGYAMHMTEQLMAPTRRWAAVCSRAALRPLPDPHGASAMAEVDGLRVCSSILPWRSCGERPPWIGGNTAERTASAVQEIESAQPMIWGGDWNHSLSGREGSGSLGGRRAITDALAELDLQTPTGELPHHLGGLFTIDHIAVPRTWDAHAAGLHPALAEGVRLSDHDAYVVHVTRRSD
jgi:hypothetical protein